MSGSGVLPAVSTNWSRFGFELTMREHSARCSTLDALADHLAFAHKRGDRADARR